MINKATGQTSCYLCGGLGIVRRKVPFEHPDFGKTFPCPERCEASLARERDHIQRAMKFMFKFHGQMNDNHLAEHHLDEFNVQGKWLAASMAQLWAADAGEFSVADGVRHANYDPYGFDQTLNPSMILVGGVGTGKTTIAALAGMAINLRGGSCLMVRFDALYSMVKDSFGGDGHSENEILRTVSRVPHLILDELVDRPSDYMRQVMERLIDYRVNHRLPTIYTTNLDDDSMFRAWGDRIASRVLTAHMISVGGEVYRRRSKLVVV